MPITSILVIFIIIYVFYRNESYEKNVISLLSVSLVFSLFNNQGYFIKLGSNELFETSKIVGWILVVYSLSKIRYMIVPKCSLILGTLFCVIVLGEIMFSMAYPFPGLLVPLRGGGAWDEYVAGGFGKSYLEIPLLLTIKAFIFNIVYFSYITILIKSVCKKDDLIHILNRIMLGYKVVILYGCMEFVLKNIFHFDTFVFDLSAFLFGVNDNSIVTEVASRFGGIYNLQGFTREPSHFTISIFMFTVFALILLKLRETKAIKVGISYRWVIVAMILSVISGSFSAILSLSVLMVIYIYLKKELYNTNTFRLLIQSIFYIIVIILLGGGIFYLFEEELSYYIVRLEDSIYILSQLIESGLIKNTGNEGMISTIARFTSIIETANSLIDRPLIGLGYRLQWCHDTIISMLADVGIVGLIIWWKFVTSSHNHIKYDHLLLVIIMFIFGLPFGTSNLYYSISIAFLIESTLLYNSNL